MIATGSAVRAVTVGVRDVEIALHLFHDTMGLEIEASESLGEDIARAWGISAGARIVELSSRHYNYGRLRLLECDRTARPVRLEAPAGGLDGAGDVGPKAIDFYVRDPIAGAMARIEAAGYRFWSRPRRHTIGPTTSEEVLFSGPDGVPILLMVGHTHTAKSLRPGSPEGEFSEIATVSVICGDPLASRAFYGAGLGMQLVNDAESPLEFRDLVAELVGMPAGTRISWLLYAEAGQPSGKILLLHFHERTGRRHPERMRPGALGYSLLTLETSDVAALSQRLLGCGGRIVAPTTLVRRFGRNEWVCLVTGPNEELIELVQGR